MGMVTTRRLLTVLVMVTVTACAVAYLERPVRAGETVRAMELPVRLGCWKKVRDIDFDARVVVLLGTGDVAGRVYRDPENRRITLTIVRASNNRAAFHPPEYCLTGSGNELIRKNIARCRMAGDGAGSIAVNEMLFVTEDGRKMLVWNLYVAGSLVTASFYRQQMQLLSDELRNGRSEGMLVTLATVVDGSLQSAAAANGDFVRSLLPLLRS